MSPLPQDFSHLTSQYLRDLFNIDHDFDGDYDDTVALERRKGGGGGRGGGRGGGGSSTGGGKISASSFALNIANGRTATIKSKGGGRPFTLKSGPYIGRSMGGGTRGQVYGDMRYGSGYPGVAGSRSVAGAPFPFGFYPVYIPSPYFPSAEEYSPSIQGFSRPGGGFGAQYIVSKSLGPGAGRFYLVGDSSSVSLVNTGLVVNCNATNFQEPFTNLTYPVTEGTNTTHYPEPTEIVQFYRGSSFALAIDGVNVSTLPAASADAPYAGFPLEALPASVDRTFLQCVNYTIGSIIPIMDAPQQHKLSTMTIVQIVLLSIVGVFTLLATICYCYELVTCLSKLRKGRKARSKTSSQPTPVGDVEAGLPLLSGTNSHTTVLTLTTVDSHTTENTVVSESSPKVALKDLGEKVEPDLTPPGQK